MPRTLAAKKLQGSVREGTTEMISKSGAGKMRSRRPSVGATPQLSISMAASGPVNSPVTVTGSITNPAGGDTTATFGANLAGSWSNTVITLNGGVLSMQRTFTPTAVGVATITLTGNNGAASATPVTYTSNAAAAGSLAYFETIPTSGGTGYQLQFGKHSQHRWCSADGKVYTYGGDGPMRIEPAQQVNPANGSLNAVLQYDFSATGSCSLNIFAPSLGDPADGTCPYYHDGATWVFNSVDDTFYALPGYSSSYNASWDPNGLMAADIAKVFRINRTTGAWVSGVHTGANNYIWYPEHWGGAYDASRNYIWLQSPGAAAYGVLKLYDCATQTLGPSGGAIGMALCPGLTAYPGIGYEVMTQPWSQWVNPVTDELICFDGYRGFIIGVALATGVPRIIATVPALYDSGGGVRPPGTEPVGAIEVQTAISISRQKLYMTYPHPELVVGELGGCIIVVDLTTGSTYNVAYPAPFNYRNQCVWDETNEKLIVTGINGSTVDENNAAQTFLIYKHLP